MIVLELHAPSREGHWQYTETTDWMHSEGKGPDSASVHRGIAIEVPA